MSPRNAAEALAWLAHESAEPSRDWTAWCQKLARTAYGIGGGFGSAWSQWEGAHPARKHPGGTPDDAPVGAALFWKGYSPFGHVAIKGRDYENGSPSVWSNDLVVRGLVHRTSAYGPRDKWGQAYLGYLTELNGVELDLSGLDTTPEEDDMANYAQQLDRIERAVSDLADQVAAVRKRVDKQGTWSMRRDGRLADQLDEHDQDDR